MKRNLLALIIPLFILNAQAQQSWLPQGDYRVYSAHNTTAGVDLAIVQTGNISSFSNYPQLVSLTGMHQFSGSPEYFEHFLYDANTWTGTVSHNQSGDSITLFRAQLTFPQYPQVGENWRAVTFANGDYVTAEVISRNFETAMPVPDTIILIKLQSFNQSGNPKTNRFTNAEIRVGLTIGLYSFPSCLASFEDHLQDYNGSPDNVNMRLSLSDVLNIGNYRTTAGKVFGFTVGNQIHTKTMISVGGGNITELRIRKILQVNTIGNSIIVTDSVYKGGFSVMTGGPDVGKITYLTPAFSRNTDTIDLADYDFLEKREYEAVMDSSQIENYYVRHILMGLRLLNDLPGILRSDDFGRDHQVFVMPAYRKNCSALIEECSEHYFYEGLGGPYTDYMSVGGNSIVSIVYYKNDAATWGTPITMSEVLALPAPSSQRLSFYPNPADNKMQLDFSGSEGSLEVFAPDGRHIQTISLVNGSITIDTAPWAAGIYFYRLGSEGQNFSGKLVISH